MITGTVGLLGEVVELADPGARAQAAQTISKLAHDPGAVVKSIAGEVSAAWTHDKAHFLGEVVANLIPAAGGLRAASGARAAGALAQGADEALSVSGELAARGAASGLGATLSGLGARVSSVGEGLEELFGDVKTTVAKVGGELEQGATRQALLDAKDGVIDAGAESVGVAELGGLRYPVSSYEAKVSEGLTRGSRIDDPAAYASLTQQGFKGIVDLTLEGTRDAEDGAAAGLHTLNVKILDNSAPTEGQMKQFLDFVTAPENSPAYVHCEAGKGRTGVAVASYRMAVDGWPADQAIAEAKKFGLSLPNQLEFLRQFGARLAAGAIEGYPKP
jgi:predicted protein tyrosine phosphatase